MGRENNGYMRLLRSDLVRANRQLAVLETQIPEHVRDLESLELYLRGHLDDDKDRSPCAIRKELREAVEGFVASYPQLHGYGALLRFKWRVEAAIELYRLEGIRVSVPPHDVSVYH